jgi:hypothetical protein
MIRKKLDRIMEEYDSDRAPSPEDETQIAERVESPNSTKSTKSLAERLTNKKKKTTKIRFTLDLEKPLDDRLNKAANRLNRSKADLARIALERLLDELEQ